MDKRFKDWFTAVGTAIHQERQVARDLADAITGHAKLTAKGKEPRFAKHYEAFFVLGLAFKVKIGASEDEKERSTRVAEVRDSIKKCRHFDGTGKDIVIGWCWLYFVDSISAKKIFDSIIEILPSEHQYYYEDIEPSEGVVFYKLGDEQVGNKPTLDDGWPGSVRDTKVEHWKRAEHLFTDTVDHPVVGKFRDFVFKKRVSGYWLLRAGPGVGKSVIMAQIAERLRGECQLIPFFFEYRDLNESKDEITGRQAWYNTICSQLICHFSLQGSPLRKDFNEQDLKGLLKRVSKKRSVSKDNPLVIVTDALDESMQVFDYGFENPFILPRKLDDHIFMAFSIRANPASKSSWKMKYVDEVVDLGMHSEDQKKAVTVYVEHTLTENKFHNVLNSAILLKDRPRIKEVVNSIACEAGYNFMVLRIALHEESLWCIGGGGIDGLADNLHEFYNKYFDRMRQDEQLGANYKVAFAFCYSYRMKQKMFEMLARLDNSQESKLSAKKLFNQWLRQGLIEMGGGGMNKFNTASRIGYPLDLSTEWVQLYHKSFLEYINWLSKEEMGKESWRIISANILDDENYLKNMLVEVIDDGVLACTQLVSLILHILERSKVLEYLLRVLMLNEFWRLSLHTVDGVQSIFQIFKNIPVGEGASRWEAAFEKVGRFVYNSTLSSAGEDRLIKPDQKPLDWYSDVLDASKDVGAVTEMPGYVSLYSSFLRLEV